MACRDGRDDAHYIEVEKGVQTQRLCAVFTVLEKRGTLDKTLDEVDWVEAGTDRSKTEAWWRRHKEEDRRRKEQKQKDVERAKRRKIALLKLSAEERALLGL